MRKKLLALLLCVGLVLIFIPQAVQAADVYTYIDENGDTKTTVGLIVTPGTETLTSGWYVVNSNVTRNGTITVSGSVNLILMDGFTLTVTGSDNSAGIAVTPGNSLSVYGQAGGTGTLTAQGGYYGAGIGGGLNVTGGTITLIGGTVNATGHYGAGIGGGSFGEGGEITIKGGKIDAQGGIHCAGIGGGNDRAGGTITIEGGTVKATGGNLGAGIGGGRRVNVGGHGGTITIEGGTITAQGSDGGAGIGGGYGGAGGTISIKDGTVFGGGGPPTGAGIGGGYNGTGGTITIEGGTVSATGALYGAGIGGGQYNTGGTISIKGGTVIAGGGNYGAGIGGGYVGDGGNITIEGGTVTATGRVYGAGIGGGEYGAGGIVLIDGANTVVSAAGGNNGYDIGSGHSYSNPTGGSLSLTKNATVMMNRNGTNASTSFTTGTVGGTGAGLLAGTYLNSQKLLSITSFTASPASGAKAFENVTLTANVTGLSSANPLGQIVFYAGGTPIGQSSLTRVSAGSANATAQVVWSTRAGTHTLTAQYIQNAADSYYMTGTGQITGYAVAKSQQATLGISGIPGTVTYGDAPFLLSVSGGSGTGSLSYQVTSGDAVSVSASGIVTVIKAGTAQVTVTKAGDTNYLPVSANVSITVNKATPPAILFPSASTITYEQKLSDSALTGGSGDGSFAWENPNTVPTVNNSGYTVIFTPYDADNYDYTGITLSQTVSITVNKATPIVTFPSAEEITYEQTLSDSTLTGGSGDGNFAWENPDTIPTVVNSGYRVIFTPHDTDNYNPVTQTVPISVLKAEQASLVIDGIPDTITYGDLPFGLLVSGGSGTGGLSYEVADGDAVSVDTNGIVTIEKAGEATVRVTNAADSNYHAVDATVNITVNKAVPDVIFPSAGLITYGQSLSASDLTGGSGDGSFEWESPHTVPTVINDGFDVVFTPFDTDNYLPIKQIVTLTVAKAVQAPLTVSGIPDTITYGDVPFRLTVGGGSGTGYLSYAVVTGNAVTVDASGKVTITHGGIASIKVTNLGDDNYLPVSRTISLTVNKAKQTAALAFALPDTITYGDAPFQIIGSGGNGSGAFGYGVTSGESVAVSATGTVTVLRPGDAVITAIKASDGDYLSQEKTIRISVGKGTQNALTISGIPQRITVGQAPFSLTVNGGSGLGALSYAVISGSAVSVSSNGTVTILKPGSTMLTVTKAADDYYHDTTVTVEINVRRAASTTDNLEAPLASPTPSAAPSSTVVPSSTPKDAPAAATESPAAVMLKPVSIHTDERAGMVVATINIDDLPEGTTAIRLPSGQIIQIDTKQGMLELSISQNDLNEYGELMIVALDKEDIPLGNYQIDLSNEVVWRADLTDSGAGILSVIAWIVAALVIVAASVAVVKWVKNKR